MTQFRLDCTYCGFHWIKELYWTQSKPPSVDYMTCLRCHDKNIKIKKVTEDSDVFGYKKGTNDERET